MEIGECYELKNCIKFELFELEENPIVVSIKINELQEQTFYLSSGKNINVGIVHPLLLKDIDNHFKVKAYYVDENQKAIKSVDEEVIITHFVIDDKIVNCKSLRSM